jgi:DNA-binding HxlR family transcriptional regulator
MPFQDIHGDPSLEAQLRTPDLEILKLPAKMFEPHRILIMRLLYLSGQAEFRQLKFGLGLSDGNLFSHLRALERDGQIMVDKTIVDRKLRTAYELTDEGKKTFKNFLTVISSLEEPADFK